MKQINSRFGAVIREWQDPEIGVLARQMVRDALAKASAGIDRNAIITRLTERGNDQDESVAAADEALAGRYHGVRSPLTTAAEEWLLKEDPAVIYETFLKVLSGDAMNDLVQTVYDNRGAV